MNGQYIIKGTDVIELASDQVRRFRLAVVSTGCSLWLRREGEDVMIYAGHGSAKVNVTTDANQLVVHPMSEDDVVKLDVFELRQHEVGWLDEPSLTDLEPRPAFQISPEMQAVIDQMNRNAIIREQAMLRALGRRESRS